MAPKLLAAALALVLLCSCAPISMNTEDLLVPPRLNERQAKVEEALAATVNLSSILYKYPLRGDYRSPFVFYDIDGDGAQEAVVVFYTTRYDQESVRAKILREDADGAWHQVYDVSGQGDQVDFIQFSHVLDPRQESMLIGWQNSRTGVASLGVYSVSAQAFREEAAAPYHSLDIADYRGNGLNEIALVSLDASDTYRLTLLGRSVDGRLSAFGELSLSPEVNTILQLQRGQILGDRYALYIDELRTDTNIATEVVLVGQTGLQPLVGEGQEALYAATFRQEEMLSIDLMGDGQVEIPSLSPLPGYFSDGEIQPPSLVSYMRLTATNAFETAYSCVVNADAGYRVFFPDRWLGEVTVLRRPDSNEWQFYKVDHTTDLPSLELLRIRVYSSREYQDQFVTANYLPLAEKGIFQYYAYLPRPTGDALAMTEGELRRSFSLI